MNIDRTKHNGKSRIVNGGRGGGIGHTKSRTQNTGRGMTNATDTPEWKRQENACYPYKIEPGSTHEEVFKALGQMNENLGTWKSVPTDDNTVDVTIENQSMEETSKPNKLSSDSSEEHGDENATMEEDKQEADETDQRVGTANDSTELMRWSDYESDEDDKELKKISAHIVTPSRRNLVQTTLVKFSPKRNRDQMVTASPDKTHLGKTPKTRVNELVRKAQDEEKNEQDEEMEDPPELQSTTGNSVGDQEKTEREPWKPKVSNPYIRASKAISYSNIANEDDGQTQIKTHSKIKEKYEALYEITFQVPRSFPENPTLRDDTEALQEKVMAILARAREVNNKAKINTWFDTADGPTIAKTADIPVTYQQIRQYMNHTFNDRRVRPGKNNGWRIRLTSSVPADEFVHYWNLSKREFTRAEYITLRKAPIQCTKYHTAGYLLNSSDGQLVEQLESDLKKELGFPVGIGYRPAALDKKSSDHYWRKAKKEATDQMNNIDLQRMFQKAPFVQQIYVGTRQEAVTAAGHLHQKYGRQTEDGQYPRFSDGTRMRFIPASIYLDMPGRQQAADLFQQQVHFQNASTWAPIPIRDPTQKFPSQGNRTMQELILDLLCEEKAHEPYFRHLKRKWFRNYNIVEYEVSIHNEMHGQAAKILRSLKKVLTEKYDETVGLALLERDRTDIEEPYDIGTASFSGISLETDDRYLNGKAKFIIEGIERLNEQETKLSDVRGIPAEQRSVNPRSSASNMSGQTGFTVPDSHYDKSRFDQTQGQNSRSTITDSENEWKLVGTARDARELEKYARGRDMDNTTEADTEQQRESSTREEDTRGQETNNSPDDDPERKEAANEQAMNTHGNDTKDMPDDDPEQQEDGTTQERQQEQLDPSSSDSGEIQI